MSLNENKYKSRSTKGYYGIMKAVVTRNYYHLPKPQIYETMMDSITEFLPENLTQGISTFSDLKSRLLNNISMNPYDVQVWIPAYHGGNNPDLSKIGTEFDVGTYPWAQVCGPLFKDEIGYSNLYNGEKDYIPETFGVNTDTQAPTTVWTTLFEGSYMEDCPSTYPGIGDTVFVAFENGDINRPVVIGSLMCKTNRVKYSGGGASGLSLTGALGGMTPAGTAYNSSTIVERINVATLQGATVGYPFSSTVRVSSKFGWRGAIKGTSLSERNFHNGVDLAAGLGTVVAAGLDGTATGYWQEDGFGYHVKIATTLSGNSVQLIYAHLDSFMHGIGVGTSVEVKQGESIGKVGSTGNSSGPHLHFSLVVAGAQNVWKDSQSGKVYGPKDYVDPTGVLGLT